MRSLWITRHVPGTPQLGEIIILRNVNGFYVALQVLGIKDDTRGEDKDELRFRYAIQSDGSDTFTEFKDILET